MRRPVAACLTALVLAPLAVAAPHAADDPLALPEDERLTDVTTVEELVLVRREEHTEEPSGVERWTFARARLDGERVALVERRGEVVSAETLGVVRYGERTLFTGALELVRQRAFHGPQWAEPDVQEIAWDAGYVEAGDAESRRKRRVRTEARPVARPLAQVFLARPEPGEVRELVVLDGLEGAVRELDLIRRRPQEVRRAGQEVEVDPYWFSGEEEALLLLSPHGDFIELSTGGGGALFVPLWGEWETERRRLAENSALRREVARRIDEAWQLDRDRWENPALGLRLELRRGWARVAGAEVFTLAPEHGRWRLEVVAELVGDHVDLAAYVEEVAADLRARYAFDELEDPPAFERGRVELEDREAVRLDLEPPFENDVVRTWVFLDRGIGYALEAVCEEDAAEEGWEDVGRLLERLRFRDR